MKGKRLVSVFLAVFLVLALLPAVALAEESTEGTAAEYGFSTAAAKENRSGMVAKKSRNAIETQAEEDIARPFVPWEPTGPAVIPAAEDAITPETEAVTPEPEAALPEPEAEVALPESEEVVTPEPEATISEPETALPEDEAASTAAGELPPEAPEQEAAVSPLADGSVNIDGSMSELDIETAIQAALYAPGVTNVLVTGSKTNVAYTLELTIPAGVTLQSQMQEGVVHLIGLLLLHGSGTIEILDGGSLEGAGPPISAEDNAVKVSGGAVSSSAEQAYAIGTGGDVIVSGGTVYSGSTYGQDDYTIWADGNVTVSGGEVGSEGSTAIYSYVGTVTVSGGGVHSYGGYASINNFNDVTVNGGAVWANGIAVFTSGNVTVSGGTVSSVVYDAVVAEGNVAISNGVVSSKAGCAVFTDGDVTISGGTVSSLSYDYCAVDALYGTTTVTGGFVFGLGIILEDVLWPGGTVVKPGIVVACPASVSEYADGSSSDLFVYPAGAAANWGSNGVSGGVYYRGESNAGFLPIEEVTVKPAYKYNIAGTFDYDQANDMLGLLNALRNENGAPALELNGALQEAAMQRAAEISVLFEHKRPDGTDCATAIQAYWYYVGENICWGSPRSEFDAAAAVAGFADSQGHFENMIDLDFDSVGIGCFYGNDGKIYFVQLFAGGMEDDASGRRSGKVNKSVPVVVLDELLSECTIPGGVTPMPPSNPITADGLMLTDVPAGVDSPGGGTAAPTVADLQNWLSLAGFPGYTIQVTDASGAPVGLNDPIGTGMTVTLSGNSSAPPSTLTVSIKGDLVGGNGLVRMDDVQKLFRGARGSEPLTGAQRAAGDVFAGTSAGINMGDAQKLFRVMRGRENL